MILLYVSIAKSYPLAVAHHSFNNVSRLHEGWIDHPCLNCPFLWAYQGQISQWMLKEKMELPKQPVSNNIKSSKGIFAPLIGLHIHAQAYRTTSIGNDGQIWGEIDNVLDPLILGLWSNLEKIGNFPNLLIWTYLCKKWKKFIIEVLPWKFGSFAEW